MKFTSTVTEFYATYISNANKWSDDPKTPKYIPLKCKLGRMYKQWANSIYESENEDLVRCFVSACNGKYRAWKLESVGIRNGMLFFDFANPKTRDEHGICQLESIVFDDRFSEFTLEPDDGDAEPTIYRIEYLGCREMRRHPIAEIVEIKEGKYRTVERVIERNGKFWLETSITK